MPFQKGHAKTGGKRTGCKNKITKDIKGLLDRLGCNPIEGMARIAIDSKVNEQIRLRANAEIAKYVHPQLSSVQHSNDPDNPLLDIESVRAFLKQG